jgi:hypothetical protein
VVVDLKSNENSVRELVDTSPSSDDLEYLSTFCLELMTRIRLWLTVSELHHQLPKDWKRWYQAYRALLHIQRLQHIKTIKQSN